MAVSLTVVMTWYLSGLGSVQSVHKLTTLYENTVRNKEGKHMEGFLEEVAFDCDLEGVQESARS